MHALPRQPEPGRAPPRHREEIGDLVSVLKVSLPDDKTQTALTWNNAILLATAIITVFLAMVASLCDRPLRDRQAAASTCAT